MGITVRLQLLEAERYEVGVLPAYRAFAERGDVQPLLVQLAEARARLPEAVAGSLKTHMFNAKEIGWEEAALARGGEGLSHRVTTETMPLLIESCLAWRVGFNPEQSVSATSLVRHLYARSPWIEALLTGIEPVRGQELPVGGPGCIVSRDQVERLHDELRAMPLPDDIATREQIENLRNIVAASLDRPGLALLYRIV